VRPSPSHPGDPFAGPIGVVFVLFWTTSFVRVVGAIHDHEIFGAEPTLALLVVVGGIWGLSRALRARWSRSEGFSTRSQRR
jgi:hypothetical protein